jgi:3-hydroxyisobutyrate dehydrogenase-like beta-hydroxyacid dehydrogenase
MSGKVAVLGAGLMGTRHTRNLQKLGVTVSVVYDARL